MWFLGKRQEKQRHQPGTKTGPCPLGVSQGSSFGRTKADPTALRFRQKVRFPTLLLTNHEKKLVVGQQLILTLERAHSRGPHAPSRNPQIPSEELPTLSQVPVVEQTQGVSRKKQVLSEFESRPTQSPARKTPTTPRRPCAFVAD